MFTLLLTLCIILCSNHLVSAEQCPDLSSLRTDYVAKEFNQTKSLGFWYEIAYKDLAQIGETCQYYNRPSDEASEAGFGEDFGFTYGERLASHLELYYSSTNETGLFEKYMKKTPFATFPSVVIDVTMKNPAATDDNYYTLTEYICSEIAFVKYEEIRIASREPSVSDEMMQQLLGVLEEQGINTSGIKYVTHSEECKYQ